MTNYSYILKNCFGRLKLLFIARIRSDRFKVPRQHLEGLHDIVEPLLGIVDVVAARRFNAQIEHQSNQRFGEGTGVRMQQRVLLDFY